MKAVKVYLLTIIFAGYFGVLLPYLISAKSNELVLFGLLSSLPVAYIMFISFKYVLKGKKNETSK